MNSCFIQYNGMPAKFVKVAQKLNSFWQEWTVFCELQIKFNNLEVKSVSLMVHYYVLFVCLSLEKYTYPAPTILYCPI